MNIYSVNNRDLSVREVGHPSGFPVFYAHGNPGSKMELLFFKEKARQFNFRFIGFDRPGIGNSPFFEPYHLTDYARDIERLSQILDIQKFGVMGWSSGLPPTLAASSLLSDSIVFCFVLSGYINFAEKGLPTEFFEDKAIKSMLLVKSHPQLFENVARLIRWADLYLPDLYLHEIKQQLHHDDQRILSDKRIARLFRQVQRHALLQGTDGALQDLEVQAGPWDFEPDRIRTKVDIFQGKEDAYVPWKFAEHLNQTIPNSQLHLYEERGHLYPLWPAYQDEIFQLARQRVMASNH